MTRAVKKGQASAGTNNLSSLESFIQSWHPIMFGCTDIKNIIIVFFAKWLNVILQDSIS